MREDLYKLVISLLDRTENLDGEYLLLLDENYT